MTAAVSRDAGAQSPPPVQGTVALEGTMKTFYRGVNVVIVTTIDGVEHAYHFAKDLVVHGGNGTTAAALEGLHEGSTVVVHYTVEGAERAVREVDIIGDQGLEVTEGTVSRIDRGRGQIKRVAPVYPDIAVAAKVTGVVILEATVNADATVEQVRVLRSVKFFDQAAIDAVKQSQYSPLVLNGVPTPFVLSVVLNRRRW
jgi:TonB family protein